MLKLRNHNIILPKYLKIVKKKGSSFVFFASGGWNKKKKEKPAGKIAVGSEGATEGGCEGNPASPEPKRSPAALLAESKTQQKSFLFLLPARRSLGAGGEEKISRAQIKKCEENFFAGWRALASGGGAERQFRSKKFRAKFRISHQSQLSPFWERIASRLRHSAFGLCSLRKAIKSHGGQKEKEMDLSFSYLK